MCWQHRAAERVGGALAAQQSCSLARPCVEPRTSQLIKTVLRSKKRQLRMKELSLASEGRNRIPGPSWKKTEARLGAALCTPGLRCATQQSPHTQPFLPAPRGLKANRGMVFVRAEHHRPAVCSADEPGVRHLHGERCPQCGHFHQRRGVTAAGTKPALAQSLSLSAGWLLWRRAPELKP